MQRSKDGYYSRARGLVMIRRREFIAFLWHASALLLIVAWRSNQSRCQGLVMEEDAPLTIRRLPSRAARR